MIPFQNSVVRGRCSTGPNLMCWGHQRLEKNRFQAVVKISRHLF